MEWKPGSGYDHECFDLNLNKGPPAYISHRHDAVVAGHNGVHSFD